MRRAWGLGVGLAVLGAVAWLVFPATPGTGSPAPKTERDAAPRASAVLQAAVQAPSRVSDAEPARLAIQGTVRGPKGPVAGARVLASLAVPGETLSTLPCEGLSRLKALECTFRPSQAQRVREWVEARHGEALVRAEALTAEDGSFSLPGLEPGTYALWAESPEGFAFRPEVAAGSASVELRLGAGARLSGTVTDDAKAPVPGALVTVVFASHSRFFEALTDATGHFQLGPLPPGEFVAVIAKKGLLTALEPLEAYTAEVKRDFKLLRPWRIQGRVLLDQVPMAGVEVRAEGDEEQELSATTDQEGRFSFEELSPGIYELTARHSDKGASEKLALQGTYEGTVTTTLELRPAVFIEGVVHDENHQPLARAEVELSWVETASPEVDKPWISSVVYTDDEGRYRSGGLPPGSHSLRVTAKGYRVQDEDPRELAVGVESWDVTLRPALIVEGVVVDASGLPVEDESVGLRSIGGEGSEWDMDMTRSNGHFTLAVSEPGTFQLKLEGQQVHPLELKITVPAEPLRIVAERLLQLTGEVVDEAGTPLPGIEVGLWPEGAGPKEKRLEEERTDGEGRFSLHVSTPGRYVVVAELFLGRVVRYASQGVEIDGKGEARVRLRLEAGRRLMGVVVDWRGRPLPKVPVQLMSAPRTFITYRCNIAPACVETGEEGRFSFQEASGEQFDVCVRKEGYSPLTMVPGDSGCVRVRNDGQEVRIVVGRDVFVTGRVVHPDGSPVTQFRVNGREVSREDGEISLLIHQPGVEQIELSAPGLQTVRRTAPEFPEGVEIQDLGSIVLSP